MKILFINAKHTNNNCFLLIEYSLKSNIDVLIVAEGTKLLDDYHQVFSNAYKYNSLNSCHGKRRIRIFSRLPFKKLESITLKDAILKDKLNSKILSFQIHNHKFLVAHNPTDNEYFDDAMQKIVKIAKNENPIIFGDMNFGFSDESPKGGLSFKNSQHYLRELYQFGYQDINYNKGMFSYVSNRTGSRFRIDLLLSKSNVFYVYVGDENGQPFKGFDHKGILFSI